MNERLLPFMIFIMIILSYRQLPGNLSICTVPSATGGFEIKVLAQGPLKDDKEKGPSTAYYFHSQMYSNSPGD